MRCDVLPWTMAALLAASAAGTATATEVRPGGVVRWAGVGTESCRSGDRTWAPLGDVCYYPVDLEASGVLTLARSRKGVQETAEVRVGAYPYAQQELTVPERMVHLSKADLARAERERERVDALWARETRPRFSLPLAEPLERPHAHGSFGSRRVFNGEPRSPHSGEDFSAAPGTPVMAAAGGEVLLADDLFFSGRSVFIDHGDGLVTMYFHLSKVLVKEGQRVGRGQMIGRVGSTGRVTGPHLHFGVRWHGARVDPALLFAPPEELPAVQP